MQVVLAELFPGVVDAADGTFGALLAAIAGMKVNGETAIAERGRGSPVIDSWLFRSGPVVRMLRRMLTRRLVALYVGLWLYGTSMAVMIRAGLGLDPWDVFHQGVAAHVPLSFGAVTALTGVAVLLAWIPLRQRPGLGTISNVVVIAIAVDVGLWLIPAAEALWVRVLAMIVAVVVNAAATVLYIGAGMGPGPRDGLMTGLVARTGWPVWSVRTGIEATVLITGWLLGGSVGIGTLVYAFGIGPLIQLMIPYLDGWLPGFEQPADRTTSTDQVPEPTA